MPSFVRKSLITISAQFVPPGWRQWIDGVEQSPPTQPSAAEVVLSFRNPGGAKVSTTLAMTIGEDGLTWTAQWDSSAAGRGLVKWVVFASGGVQAANEGEFYVEANSVNTF